MTFHRLGIALWVLVALIPLRAQTDNLFGEFESLEALLDTEISTASKHKQTANDAPAAVAVITADDIARHGYRNIVEVLDSVRGLFDVNDRLAHRIGTRGISSLTDSNHRMLLLVNGQVMNEWLRGYAIVGNASLLILETVERIEIMRGPASALYGSNAMFLVVNIITRDGAQFDGGQVGVSVGQEGERVASATYGTSLGGEADALVSVQTADIDGSDYYSAFHNATATDNDSERFSKVFGSLNAGRFRSHAFFTTIRKQMPTGGYGAEFGNPDSSILDERFGGQAEFEAVSSATANIRLRSYFQSADSVIRFVDAKSRPPNVQGSGVSAGAEGRLIWDVRVNNRLTLGVEYRDNFNTSLKASTESGIVFFDGGASSSVLSIYAFDEYQINPDLLVSFGVRHDRHSSSGSSATAPRAALIYHPFPASAVKLLYGEAFRSPTFIEREFVVPFILAPNPNLRPEKVQTYEAVWEQRIKGAYFATASVYRNDIDGLIQGYSREVTPSMFRNGDKILASGVELEAWARWTNGSGGYMSYSYQHAAPAESDERLDYSPAHLMKLGATVRLLDSAFVALDGRYISSQFKLTRSSDTQRRVSDGYFVMDTAITTKPIFDFLRLQLRVTNLLNTAYEMPLERYDIDRDNDGIPDATLDSASQKGRQIVLSANARF
ncbi:MAG: TonB-dependent receptor [Candidatus Poribacteria bacterium]|nr:TonB-dependent receptor [Candidatus Poribacteria bacterium]